MLLIDPAAYGRSDLYDIALARRVAAHLGSGVMLTRSGDVEVPLHARHALAQRTQAHTYLSLDAQEGADAVWVHPSASPKSHALAGRVASALGQRLEVGSPPQLEPGGLPRTAAACHVVVDPQRDFHDTAERLASVLYGNLAEAQTIAPPTFDPRNVRQWQRDLAAWTADLQAFIMGVPPAAHDTWPHNSICKLYTKKADGTRYRPPGPAPTGFFISEDRILTNAHVTRGVVECLFAPGEHNTTPRNAGTVRGASKFKTHPRYATHGRGWDLGVIKLDRPVRGIRPLPLRELAMSIPRGISLCGYAAQVDPLARRRWRMAPNIDPNIQHMSRGGATSTTTTEIWNYTIQALPGSSGSPVWWFNDAGRLEVIGVHAGANTTTPRFNEGVRLTRDKIRWARTV